MQLIARQRGMGIVEIILHDLLQSSPFLYFDLPAKADKSMPLAEIENHLNQDSWSSVNNLKKLTSFWPLCQNSDKCNYPTTVQLVASLAK